MYFLYNFYPIFICTVFKFCFFSPVLMLFRHRKSLATLFKIIIFSTVLFRIEIDRDLLNFRLHLNIPFILLDKLTRQLQYFTLQHVIGILHFLFSILNLSSLFYICTSYVRAFQPIYRF